MAAKSYRKFVINKESASAPTAALQDNYDKYVHHCTPTRYNDMLDRNGASEKYKQVLSVVYIFCWCFWVIHISRGGAQFCNAEFAMPIYSILDSDSCFKIHYDFLNYAFVSCMYWATHASTHTHFLWFVQPFVSFAISAAYLENAKAHICSCHCSYVKYCKWSLCLHKRRSFNHMGTGSITCEDT